MNSNIIESMGISYLDIFLGKTKKIHSQINKRDKYPIWDGEILLYNSEKFSSKNLYCRVPVQVKSSINEKPEKEKNTYSVSIVDLKKYADDGGVLFIQVIFNENEQKAFYMNLLLPADIFEILSKVKPSQQSTTIYLERIKNAEEVITMCKNYKIHSKLQAQIPKNIDMNYLNGPVELYSYSYINNIKDILTKPQYAYAKLGYDVFGYVGKYMTSGLDRTIKVNVGTNKKAYYNKITEIITTEESYYMLGNYVKLKENKIIISYELIDDNIISAINDFEFVSDLLENKNIVIGNKKTMLLFEEEEKIKEKIKIINNKICYFKCALEAINNIGLSVERANIKKVMDDENLICQIRDIVLNENRVYFENEKDSFLNVVDVLNQKYLIYFIRDKENYKGFNYIKNPVILQKLIVQEDKAQLSRYFNLKANVLCNLNLDFEEIKKEMNRVTKNEITISFISNLLLEFINCYDLTEKNIYLDIAEYINKLIRYCNGYGENYYLINKYQMLKRRKKLSNDDIKNIKKIKVNNLNDINILCACCLLCDDNDEFQLYFDKLGFEQKEIFKSWAIYKLYKVKTDD